MNNSLNSEESSSIVHNANFFSDFTDEKEFNESLKNIKPTDDFVFRAIFGQQKNAEITKQFTSRIIGRDIKTIKLIQSKSILPMYYGSKTSVIDVEAQIDDDILCDIEMQVSEDHNMTNRMLEYWAKEYLEQSDYARGLKNYRKLKKTIVILILKYKDEMIESIPKLNTSWHIREDDYTEYMLTDKLEFYIISLRKLKNDKLLKNNPKLVSWLKFLENPKLEEKDMNGEEHLIAARKEFEGLLSDEEIRYIARQRYFQEKDAFCAMEDAKEEAELKGKKEGIKEGKKEKQIEIAKKMLKANKPIDEIIEFTELSDKEIIKLK